MAKDLARSGLKEFGAFAWKQVLCSLFPLWIFFCLWISRGSIFGVARYDFMLIACLAMQAFLVLTKLETIKELETICAFHLLGLLLELYKVNHGSWSYPEPAYFKFAGVPIYSGFMYASVASYLIQAWRRFDLGFENFPRWYWISLVGIAIYANFFLSRAFGDNRWLIVAGVFAIFARTSVTFVPIARRFAMPMIVAFFAIGLFVWFAENLCTYLGAWQYPHQRNGWEIVDLGKLSSWCLLVIVSFILVAALKRDSARTLRVCATPDSVEDRKLSMRATPDSVEDRKQSMRATSSGHTDSMPDALLFDLDGTLVDSEPWHKRSEIETFAKWGIELKLEDLAPFTGTTLPFLLNGIGKRFGKTISPEEFMEAQIPVFRDYIEHKVKLFPDAERLIERLNGKPAAIVTSAMPWYVQAVLLRHAVLQNAFPIVISAEHVSKGKPEPEAFLLAAQKLGLEAENCVAIEDSVNGIKSALAAGCKVVGIDRENHGRLAEAHRVIASLDELEL